MNGPCVNLDCMGVDGTDGGNGNCEGDTDLRISVEVEIFGASVTVTCGEYGTCEADEYMGIFGDIVVSGCAIMGGPDNGEGAAR